LLAVAVVLEGTADTALPAQVAGMGFRAFWALP